MNYIELAKCSVVLEQHWDKSVLDTSIVEPSSSHSQLSLKFSLGLKLT